MNICKLYVKRFNYVEVVKTEDLKAAKITLLNDLGFHASTDTLMEVEEVSSDEELDGNLKLCDCCQTGGAQTSSVAVIAYRDRSEFEIRDMSFVRRVNGEWSSPKSVNEDNWEVPGCPVNGPRLAAMGSSISIAWFTAANGLPRVNFAFSEDEGRTFRTPVVITTTNTSGRVDVAMTDSSTAFVSWLGTSDSTSMIMVRKVNLNGELESPMVVAETSASRASGFPQMAYTGGEDLIMAWTDVQNETAEIKMATISVQSN